VKVREWNWAVSSAHRDEAAQLKLPSYRYPDRWNGPHKAQSTPGMWQSAWSKSQSPSDGAQSLSAVAQRLTGYFSAASQNS
jgi:hypothetical protein